MNLKKLATGSLCFCLAMFSTMAFAQTKEISGKVTDSKDGSAIPGITVQGTTSKGKKIGTATGTDGSFKLSSADGITKVTLSGAGFEKQELNVTGKTDVSVSMKASNTSLNEVVVIGYGTRKVKDLTGSVATVTAKDFNKGVIASPQELFQGRTPGVTVTASSGEPGAAISVNIRGASSIYNSEPLYIVDGVPLYGGGSSSTGGGNSSTSTGVEGGSTAKNPLIFLNPNDIESITILKDASSTAIYGAAGANGVVIITTKAGRGKGGFQFNATTSRSTPANRYDLLNAQDFLVGVKKANIDAGASPADATVAVKNVDKGASTNWQDQIFQTGISQSYGLAWGFAKKETTLRLSGAYDDQTGIVKNSSLKRITARANFSQKLFNDKLKIDANVSVSNIKNVYPPISNNAGYQGSLIGAAISFNPTNPIFNKDGSYYDPLDGNRNPAEMLAYFNDRDNTNRLLSNLSLTYKILDGLNYKFTLGFDESKALRKSFADPRLSTNAFGGDNFLGSIDLKNQIFGNGRGLYQNKKYNSTLVDHILTYDKSFKNGHELNAFVGYHYQAINEYNYNDIRWGLTTPVVLPTDNFVKDINHFTMRLPYYVGDTAKGTEQSYFAKANYIINSKYYFTASVRVDGDSRFGKNNKYGTFPAGAVKWRISNEEFFKSAMGSSVNDLSIRASYGVVGSKGSVPRYGSLSVRQDYDLSSMGLGKSDQTLTNANPNLKWESTAAAGIGVDYALFNNRLKGSVDLYHKNTKDLIFFNYFLPRSTSPYRWENLKSASVINKGIEFSFDFEALQHHNGKGLQWEVLYNMAFNNNKVINLPTPIVTGGVNGRGLSGAYAQEIVNNYPLFTWKMPVFAGFDGNGNQRTLNNDPNDKLLGSPLPTFTAGLTNNFSLGNWNVSFFINTATGFYIYNNTANALFVKGILKSANNVTYAVANSPENPINPGSVSSRFLEKGDFARLSNASLGYTFKLKGNGIKTLNIGISGQNLLLVTHYSGLDPEVNVDHSLNGVPSRGFDYAGYPKARTFTIGLNMGF